MNHEVFLPLSIARRRGIATYFTGNPCKNNHVELRLTKYLDCCLCKFETTKRNNLRRKNEPCKAKVHRESSKKYYKENKDKVILYITKWKLDKRKSDPIYLLRHRLSRAIQKWNVKKLSYESVIGCDLKQFRLHIEKQFVDGMSWDNRKDWHIDHIIPCSSAKTADEIKSLFHFTNLRPIWAKDNLVKSNKIEFLI